LKIKLPERHQWRAGEGEGEEEVAAATRLEGGGIWWPPEPGRLTARKEREVGNAQELARFSETRG
jgi:hypothetical protein